MKIKEKVKKWLRFKARQRKCMHHNTNIIKSKLAKLAGVRTQEYCCGIFPSLKNNTPKLKWYCKDCPWRISSIDQRELYDDDSIYVQYNSGGDI
jgi:ribosome biogenesis GTPase A